MKFLFSLLLFFFLSFHSYGQRFNESIVYDYDSTFYFFLEDTVIRDIDIDIKIDIEGNLIDINFSGEDRYYDIIDNYSVYFTQNDSANIFYCSDGKETYLIMKYIDKKLGMTITILTSDKIIIFLNEKKLKEKIV